MTKIIAYMGILSLLVFMQVLVMEYGWGLEPKSWWWIIGVGFFANLFVRMIQLAIEEEDK